MNRSASYVQHLQNLVGREALEGLQSSVEIVGAEEVGEMPRELIVVIVVITLDDRVLDRSVHVFNQTCFFKPVFPAITDIKMFTIDSGYYHSLHHTCRAVRPDG